MHRGARALRSGAGPLVGLAPGGAHPHRMKHALQVDVGRSVPPCDNILSEPNWARASERSGRHQPEVRFSDWGARWLDSLERKPSTVTSQGRRSHTLRKLLARGTWKYLAPMTSHTQQKVVRKKMFALDAREAPSRHRPAPERKEAAYLENEELPRLFAELSDASSKTLCLVALKRGIRQGELFALRLGDVDLEQAVVGVRRSYTGGVVSTPKNRERRDVDLIPVARRRPRPPSSGWRILAVVSGRLRGRAHHAQSLLRTKARCR